MNLNNIYCSCPDKLLFVLSVQMAVKKCKHLDVSNVMAVNNLSDY